ncbi:hypothetical protein HDU97_008441 [Phlyctochytrium planicorne]|nr:hypothetical protein HDU97_008441 [Phlyctochytrium planicorne]
MGQTLITIPLEAMVATRLLGNDGSRSGGNDNSPSLGECCHASGREIHVARADSGTDIDADLIIRGEGQHGRIRASMINGTKKEQEAPAKVDGVQEMLEEIAETANSMVYPLGHEEFLSTVRDFWADDTNNATMKSPLLTIMTRLNVSTDFIRPIPTLRLEEMKLRFPYMRLKPNCLGDELFRKLKHLCRKRRWERAFNYGLIASDDEGEDETGYFEFNDDEEHAINEECNNDLEEVGMMAHGSDEQLNKEVTGAQMCLTIFSLVLVFY